MNPPPSFPFDVLYLSRSGEERGNKQRLPSPFSFVIADKKIPPFPVIKRKPASPPLFAKLDKREINKGKGKISRSKGFGFKVEFCVFFFPIKSFTRQDGGHRSIDTRTGKEL